MKPIFDKEMKFLKEQGIDIPKYSWRDGSNIYLNCKDEYPILRLKVDMTNNTITIKNNYIKSIDGNIIYTQGKIKGKKIDDVLINKTIDEEINENKKYLNRLVGESIKWTISCMRKYPDHNWRVSNSSGKDSTVTNYIFEKSLELYDKKYDYDIDFFNTTNDVADTYIKIKSDIRNTIKFQLTHKLKRCPSQEEIEEQYNILYKEWIHNPEKGFYQWLKEDKKYFVPTIMIRNCCDKYKEGKLKQVLDKKKDYVLFLGMRRFESTKRQDYDWYLNEKMDKMYELTGKNKYKINTPRKWIKFLPIVNWRDEDVWMLILWKKLDYNKIYEKGFERAGCIICPMSNPYNDLLVRYWYKEIWNRWKKLLNINYNTYDRGGSLKWTFKEYSDGGKWKTGESKIQGIITKKKTEERIKEVSKILNVPNEIAEKYFKNECKCGKKLNPDELAMYLKLFGRYEGKIDDRQYLCRSCLCDELGITKNEYSEKVQEFRSSGCNLF